MSLFLRRLPRLAAAAVTCGVLLLVGAPNASAHGANGQPIPDAQHYLSAITAITPAVPGVSATVDPRGEWLSMTNTTAQTLTILGYAREPYLRIDPTGVSENSYSPTLVLNQSLFGDLSQLGDSSLPPNWRRTSTGHEVRWHDHRIHWMGADKPPMVKSAPFEPHLVGNWNVHLLLGSTPITVTGTLRWLPMGHRAVSRFRTRFLIIDAAVFVVMVIAVAYIFRRRSGGVHDGWRTAELTGARAAPASIGASPPPVPGRNRN